MGVQPGGQQQAITKEGQRGIGASALSTTARKIGRSPAQHIKGQQPAGSRPTANEKPAHNTTAGNILEVISAA